MHRTYMCIWSKLKIFNLLESENDACSRTAREYFFQNDIHVGYKYFILEIRTRTRMCVMKSDG
jgi:hypothetical protein